MNPCDLVADRLAAGELLGELDAHVATCPSCARLVEMPRLVAARAASEPAPGFTARMTAGARHRLAVRRRNRIAGLTLAAAGVFAAAGVTMRRDDAQPLAGLMAFDTPSLPVPVALPEVSDRELAAALVRLNDVDRSLRPSAPWRRVEAPLAAYQRFLTAYRKGARP